MSDLIDRQEIYHEMTVKSMELFEKGLAWHEFRRGFDFAMEFVQEAPSTEPEQKWIPVTERLPKVRTDVLLAFEKNMAVGFYSYDCWNVNTGNGFYTGVFTDEDKPIAWMPLPESYKGE